MATITIILVYWEERRGARGFIARKSVPSLPDDPMSLREPRGFEVVGVEWMEGGSGRGGGRWGELGGNNIITWELNGASQLGRLEV